MKGGSTGRTANTGMGKTLLRVAGNRGAVADQVMRSRTREEQRAMPP